MQRQQITLDSFHCGDRAEPETSSGEAPSMSGTESVDTGPYDHLMKAVIDDNNIDEALKRVVGNCGAPGVDGMDVTAPSYQQPPRACRAAWVESSGKPA